MFSATQTFFVKNYWLVKEITIYSLTLGCDTCHSHLVALSFTYFSIDHRRERDRERESLQRQQNQAKWTQKAGLIFVIRLFSTVWHCVSALQRYMTLVSYFWSKLCDACFQIHIKQETSLYKPSNYPIFFCNKLTLNHNFTKYKSKYLSCQVITG